MTLDMLWDVMTTAGLASAGVALWTFRVAVTARGSRALAAVLAAVEAMLFVVVVSKLMDSFEEPHFVVAYGAGVAAGTLLGLALDARLNPQLSRVDVFDATGDAIEAIALAGFPFTRSEGLGAEGRVAVASVVTSDTRVEEVLRTIGTAGPSAFWTVASVRRANDMRVPGGHIRPASRRPAGTRSRAQQRHRMRPATRV